MINYIVDRLEERINTSDKTLLFLGGPAMKCMATFQNIDISQEEDHARNILLHVFAVDINNHASTTQGGACVTTLCDQGVGAVADVQENKGLPAVQRLSKHLPKISYAVLWYLLRSLPVMFQHFSFNPKTTLKSLLCVIPSMLSRQQPTFKIPTLEENQKISVIHCLMKNCLWVRRDDTTVFRTEHPQVFPSSFGASLNFNISEESAIHLDNSLEPHMKLTQKQQPAKTWLFQHVLGKSHNEMASAVALRTSQQKPLFGSLLQDVCENDELPQAILEMLFMIDQKGPATKTIFSQCANWEDCQALKEKLNSREQVNWETTCPILVATVLKDLLQNIPGSILTANLYEDFIGVLEEGNEEAKIAIIKRLLLYNLCLITASGFLETT
ncbi:uncharacterized protein LOC121161401 [Ochotona curzoniae]|uniref:uncharacterized protein LOC121161401 n=1 Tax=Ochotona curzoniae TaxID=130825 RepID=UPI001B34A5A6|nr:uncharacterized protein LOC121161401 [Ochotona curzoniae]